MSVDYAELRDFDWSARIVLASDKISGLKQPLLILKLFLERGGGEIEEKEIELSQQELNHLLASLKEAKQKIKENFEVESWLMGKYYSIMTTEEKPFESVCVVSTSFFQIASKEPNEKYFNVINADASIIAAVWNVFKLPQEHQRYL